MTITTSCPRIEARAGQPSLLRFGAARIMEHGMASPAAPVNTIYATLCNLASMREEIGVCVTQQV